MDKNGAAKRVVRRTQAGPSTKGSGTHANKRARESSSTSSSSFSSSSEEEAEEDYPSDQDEESPRRGRRDEPSAEQAVTGSRIEKLLETLLDR